MFQLKPSHRRYLAIACFAASAALLPSLLARGFGLLYLWARILGVPDNSLRVLAAALLSFVAGCVWLMLRWRPQMRETLPLLLVLVLSGGTLFGFLGKFSWWLEIYAHFRWQYAAGLLVAALYFTINRRFRLALLAAGIASVNVYVVSPQIFVRPTVEAGGGRTVRLAMANLHKRNRNAERVLRFIEREHADVLILEEFTPEWNSRLESLASSYPHSIVVPREDGHGIALFSRLPFISQEVLHFAGGGFPSILARVDVGGRALLVAGSHPPAPRNARLYRIRNRIYAGISELARASEGPLVVMGDLNSTPWGQEFRRLLEDSRLRDTSEGHGLQWSWPAGFWPLAIPIDHCLASNDVRIVNRHIGADIGSDHYPLVVDLAVSD